MGETYLGMQIYRFYIKCTKCLREITFRVKTTFFFSFRNELTTVFFSLQTDPANADYQLEHGAIRNFESIRLAEKQAKEEAAKVAEEEALNPMKVKRKTNFNVRIVFIGFLLAFGKSNSRLSTRNGCDRSSGRY